MNQSTRPSPLRTAILGYGVAGRYFHGAFLGVDPDYEVTLIATANPERAAQARAEHPGVQILEDPQKIAEHAEDLDLVVVATPPASHVELAQSALRAGLDVVVDKPFAPSSAEGAALIAEAASRGRRLTVFQNRRYDADFLTLKQLIDGGELGRVHTLESRFEWWKPAGERAWKAATPVDAGGGILYDLGPHLIDQAIQLLGPVTSCTASLRRISLADDAPADDPQAPENTAHLLLTHASGVESRLTMSSLSALEGPRFLALGTEGAWRTAGKDPQEAALRAGTRPDAPGFGRESVEQAGELSRGEGVTATPPGTGDYGRFYRELAVALRTGGTVPVDPQDSVEVLRLIEVAHRDARTA
ncbi:Gfo/Idh/MocA family oxidoreductase [Brachybacterium sp. YJGR34]|uniref:Gfo/Idh/MocA family protein n=1 Tax=Brachybacterium sp. YJGR34 TaxID=2059911 RepID=UPI000E0B13D8|nr:Gfo/Idh/MocA family oxidoreductase [Brachybacterium sp. YJGR34]